MNRRLEREVTATINELWERGIDASHLRYEIGQFIDGRLPHYDAERDWQDAGEELGLL